MHDDPRRTLRLQGASNFRDLGGYRGHGGRALRWGRLFRSDHLAGLSVGDKVLLGRMGLERSLDFRGVQERAAQAYELPGVQQHSLPIEPTVVQRLQDMAAAGGGLTPERTADLMRELYRALVNDQSHRFAEFFEHLLQAQGPLVFHCTAGKDRTGFAAALVLLALGVPREVVLQDYLVTNLVFKQPPVAHGVLPAEVLAVLWQVQPDFLHAALDAVDTDHGGVERYLEQRLGLGPAALRTFAERYLEPV
jgi:protein-tyrosine phosphatase